LLSPRLSAVRPSLLFFLTTLPTPDTSTLSLHDALPICSGIRRPATVGELLRPVGDRLSYVGPAAEAEARVHGTGGFEGRSGESRSEEHTSELQSRVDLVCRLLLEKKKRNGSMRERQVI